MRMPGSKSGQHVGKRAPGACRDAELFGKMANGQHHDNSMVLRDSRAALEAAIRGRLNTPVEAAGAKP
jgi:hypothetical protein